MGSTSSPPLPPPSTAADTLYQVPRSNSVDPLSQESAEVPTTFAISPTQKDNVYSVPKPVGGGGDLYSAPRPHRQHSREETLTTPDVGGSVIYNVPSSRPAVAQGQRPQMVKPPEEGQDLHNTPGPTVANGHDQYNSPRPTTVPQTHTNGGAQAPQNGHEIYNVPRAAMESSKQEEDDGLYRVPRPVEPHNVPKPPHTRSSYDTLQAVHNSNDYQANKAGGNPSSATPNQVNTRQPIPIPEQETYSVPRPANPSSPVGGRRGDTNGRRYPYDYVDHRLQRIPERGGTLKSSRSLESLVRNRVTLSPDSSPSFQPPGRAQRTPSPRALQHKYIEIDIDDFRETSPTSPPTASAGKRGRFHLQPQTQTRPENVYAEISDSESPVRPRLHPENVMTQPVQSHQQVNGGVKHTGINNTPLPTQQGRMYLPQTNGVSKEARALHDEGYELVLPADKAARNLTLQQQKQATPPMVINRTQSVSSYSWNTHRLANGGHPVIGGDMSLSRLGTSEPQNSSAATDEYVIVNRRDFNPQSTQPRDITVALPHLGSSSQSLSTESSSRVIVEDEYEVMSSVKRGLGDHGNRLPQFAMVPSIKKRGSVPSSNGSPAVGSLPRGNPQSIRDSLELDSIETGSRASVGSGSHLDELVGPLSPIDAGAPQNLQPFSRKKGVIRIASGIPNDITPSKELK